MGKRFTIILGGKKLFPKPKNIMKIDHITISEHHLKLDGDPFRAKIIAEGVSEYMEKHNLEDTTLSDFCYNIDARYQSFHSLDQDNWGFCESDSAVIHGAF
jgi:hypothetical protein